MEEKALKPLGENASLDANETRARMGIFHMALISSWSLDWKCLLVGSWLDVHRSCCLLLVAFLESSPIIVSSYIVHIILICVLVKRGRKEGRSPQ